MDIYEAIQTRRSIRSYQKKSVPDDILRRVLDAARCAPSANNIQPWKFILVREAERRKKVARLSWNQSFIAEAPIVVVACGLPTQGQIGGYASSVLVDVAIALDHLTLAARAEGLGTCWIGAFDNEGLKSLLRIPRELQIVAVTPLGYPSREITQPGRRKNLPEIIAAEEFGGPSPLKG